MPPLLNMFYKEIINNIKNKNVILFHSATGKDSIALIDMLHKNNIEITPVFMYLVKNLEYENKYLQWAENKYKVKFIQIPHFALLSYIKVGYMGIKKNESVPKLTIAKLDDKIRKKANINCSVYGFKKNDGLTRRFMLNDCPTGINEKTNKVYPLMDMSNKDVLMYIEDNNLIRPFTYEEGKQSSGCNISDPTFLIYMKKKHPNDLVKIFNQFPHLEAILFRYEHKNK
jgi:3'-phosphoadenosine 5'-phosphosulfate sulfotransferase (PAPS reductase)/FAD synthetase